MDNELDADHLFEIQLNPEKVIESFQELMQELRYAPAPKENPNTKSKSYLKLINALEGNDGWALITVETEKDGSEKIWVGGTLNQNSTAHTINLLDIFETRQKLGIPETQDNLDKNYLENGGYYKIAQVLLEFEREGFFMAWLEDLIAEKKELEKNKEEARRLVDILISKVAEEFRDYQTIVNEFDKNQSVAFIANPQEGEQTHGAIKFSIGANVISSDIGRVSLKGNKYQFVKEPIKWWVGKWAFEQGSLEDAQKAIEKAFVYTLASMEQQPENIVSWRNKEKSLQKIASLLGFEEDEVLNGLGTRVINNLLKNQDISEDAAKWQDAAEAHIDQNPNRLAAQIGLILARARLYLMGNRMEDFEEEVRMTIDVIKNLQYKKNLNFDMLIDLLKQLFETDLKTNTYLSEEKTAQFVAQVFEPLANLELY